MNSLRLYPTRSGNVGYLCSNGIELPLGKILYESGTTLTHVYFPTAAIVALLYEMENGASSEIAVVGNEGLVGISLFMGGESTPSRALVQCAGRGLRLNAEALKSEFGCGGVVQHLLLRYTHALITQMVLTAACSRHHSLDQQMCRWLLLSLDHLGANELVTTETVRSATRATVMRMLYGDQERV